MRGSRQLQLVPLRLPVCKAHQPAQSSGCMLLGPAARCGMQRALSSCLRVRRDDAQVLQVVSF